MFVFSCNVISRVWEELTAFLSNCVCEMLRYNMYNNMIITIIFINRDAKRKFLSGLIINTIIIHSASEEHVQMCLVESVNIFALKCWFESI